MSLTRVRVTFRNNLSACICVKELVGAITGDWTQLVVAYRKDVRHPDAAHVSKRHLWKAAMLLPQLAQRGKLLPQ